MPCIQTILVSPHSLGNTLHKIFFRQAASKKVTQTLSQIENTKGQYHVSQPICFKCHMFQWESICRLFIRVNQQFFMQILSHDNPNVFGIFKQIAPYFTDYTKPEKIKRTRTSTPKRLHAVYTAVHWNRRDHTKLLSLSWDTNKDPTLIQQRLMAQVH